MHETCQPRNINKFGPYSIHSSNFLINLIPNYSSKFSLKFSTQILFEMFNLFFPYFSTRQETIYNKPTQNQHSAQNPLTLISCLFRNVNAAGHTAASLSL